MSTKTKLVQSLLVSSCLALTLGLSACNEASVSESSQSISPQISTPAIAQDGVLRVGVDFQNAPFSVQANGKVQGLEADLALAVAEQLGLKVEFVDVGKDGGAQEIANGQIDIAMNGSSEQANSDLTVIGRYIDNAPGLFTVTSDGKPVVATQQDIESGVIGVQENSQAHSLMSKLFPKAQIQTYQSLNDAFTALSQGQIKYVASDSYAGGYLASMQDNVAYAGSLDIPVAEGVLVSSQNSTLAQVIQGVLDKISTNGVLDLIKKKWVENLPALSEDTQVLSAQEKAKAAGASVETSPSVSIDTSGLPSDIASVLASGSAITSSSAEPQVGANAMVPNENGRLEPAQNSSNN